MRIQYIQDQNGNFQEAHGSDGRLNVSARADSRSYYNSRDESESYVLVFDDANATANDYIMYLKNTKTDGKHLVVEHVTVGCEASTSVFKLAIVTGTAGGGTAATPVNLNQGGVAKNATATALTTADSSSTPMSGLSEDKLVEIIGVSGAFGSAVMEIGDELRIGQDQALAVELDAAAAADTRCFGTIHFYFE